MLLCKESGSLINKRKPVTHIQLQHWVDGCNLSIQLSQQPKSSSLLKYFNIQYFEGHCTPLSCCFKIYRFLKEKMMRNEPFYENKTCKNFSPQYTYNFTKLTGIGYWHMGSHDSQPCFYERPNKKKILGSMNPNATWRHIPVLTLACNLRSEGRDEMW